MLNLVVILILASVCYKALDLLQARLDSRLQPIPIPVKREPVRRQKPY